MRMREDASHRRGVEPPTSRRDEQRILGAARELRSPVLQVARDAERRLFAERDDALLAALSADPHLLLVEVDVAKIERDGFLAAKPGRIDQLHERAIPKRERIVPQKRVERAFDLALPWRVRQPAGPSWRERRVGDARRPEREAEEAPNGGQLPADRRRGELAASCSAELRRVLGERPDVDVLELDPAPRKPLAELAHVDSVGLSGRVRK